MKKFIAVITILAICIGLISCSKNSQKNVTVNNTQAPVEDIISKLTTEQKIGQLFCVSFSGTELSDSVKDFLKEYYVGNVILFSKNIENGEQTAKLCKELQKEITKNTGVNAFIGTDQEGGTVVRVTDGAVYYPGAMAVAAADDAENARAIGEYTGAELKALGINIDFAPVADVNSNPENPVIGSRSFGDDIEKVSEYTAAFVDGMNTAKAVSTAKHYPGHGDTETDSHYGLPSVNKSLDELMENELVPFRKLIEKNVPAIMAAHILYPQIDSDYPASMSKIMLTDVLRNQLGFCGMIVTDGLRMGAVTDNYGTANACIAAINAGADLLITGTGGKDDDLFLNSQINCIEQVQEAVENGEIPEEILDAAVARVLKCKADYKIAESDFTPLNDAVLQSHKAFAKEISRKSITVIKDENLLLPIKSDERVLILSPDTVKQLDEEDKETEISIADLLSQTASCDFEAIPALSNMSESDLNNLLASYSDKAKNYDKVIVCASRTLHKNIIEAVAAANPKTIAVLFDTPYMGFSLKNCTSILCAYEHTSDAVENVSNVLTGNDTPEGVLPVNLQ